MALYERLYCNELVFPDNKALRKIGEAAATIDPASLADGVGATSTVTVAGAAFGDYVQVAAPYDLQGISVTAYVSAANTVAIRMQNESGGILDLASGSWKVMVFRSTTL